MKTSLTLALLAGAAIMRKPDDETGADSAETTTESTSKRKQVSKRDFLLNGAVVDKIEEANAARYSLLVAGGTPLAFDSEILGEPGKFATMCAIFGYHTKIGNVANTVLNDKEEPGSVQDAGAEITAFITQATGGLWAERTTGVAGARIDKDALAASIIAVAVGAGKFAAGSDEEGAAYTKVRDRLETEPTYVRAARQVPDVAREYATRTGKATKTLADLL